MTNIPVKAVTEAIDRLFNRLLAMKSGPSRILNVTPDAAHAGKRVAPARSSETDKYCGVRVDQGMPIKDKPNHVMLKLQPNAKCDVSSVQELSNQVGTHYVIAEVEVDTTQEPTAENTEKVRAQLKANMEETAAKEAAKETAFKKGGNDGKGGKGAKGEK